VLFVNMTVLFDGSQPPMRFGFRKTLRPHDDSPSRGCFNEPRVVA